MSSFKEISINKTAILRGVGNYYGHVVKAEIMGFYESENVVRVKINDKRYMDFSLFNGWEHLEQKLYSTYQLDINHLKSIGDEDWLRNKFDNIM